MASENKEIGDIAKKCKILLLDIEGTTTSISFVKDKLFPYAEENVKKFLDSQWESDDVKDAVSALRKLAIQDKEGSVEGVVTIPGEDATKEEQIEGLVNNVKWQMSADRKAGALKQLQGLIWKQGYDSGDIKGHVYDDVSTALEAWHAADGQKIYIYSSGSVQAQKLLFGQSLAGDLLRFIDGHFDTAVGAKQEASSYKAIAEKIGCKPDEILFLTDIVKEAEAARTAGLHAALVSREGNAPLSDEATSSFPVLRSLAELTVSNKRKPEPQEEETPAKVPKTDAELTSEAEATTNSEAGTPAETAEPEKMEVEDKVTSSEPPDVPITEEVIVEEMDSTEPSSLLTDVDLEPVVEGSSEEKDVKTKEKETDKKEAEKSEETAEPKVLPAVVTEIEDISEKQLPEVADIVEDIVPVVEEPMQEDMEELQNVGEVLEKECDDILAKVHDVTNLDSIPVKTLATIAEDTMETENIDSCDIVDRILDTELAMEMKQCGDIDLNTVTEMESSNDGSTDPKIEVQDDSAKETSLPETKETPEATTPAADAPAPEKIEVIPEKIENKTEEISRADDAVQPKETKVEDQIAETVKSDTNETKVEISQTEKTESNKVEKIDTEKVDKVAPEEPKPAKEEIESIPESKNENATPIAEGTPKEEVTTTEQVPENGTSDKEPQMNGNSTNASGDAVLNGDASKDEELSARLSVENGKVNGSNGVTKQEEQGQGDCKAEEVADIKVKTVPTDEPRTDPIEQPTEA